MTPPTIRHELLTIADDAAKEHRWEDAATIRMDAYGATTGEPKERHGYQCGHLARVLVSQRTARVECAVCHDALDPLDVLRSYARHERHVLTRNC